MYTRQFYLLKNIVFDRRFYDEAVFIACAVDTSGNQKKSLPGTENVSAQ